MTAEFDDFGHEPPIFIPMWAIWTVVIIMGVIAFVVTALVMNGPKVGCNKTYAYRQSGKIDAQNRTEHFRTEHFTVKSKDGIYHIYLEFE